MHEFLHALEHAFLDTLALLPWLIVIYVAIELLENKTDFSRSGKLQGKGAPLIGAVTGLIPQCGFSVMAAKLFEQKYITLGTLFAIFLSTSDEAFIILLSDGVGATHLLPMIVSKIFIGLIVGYAIDLIMKWTGKKQTLRVRPILDEKTPTTVREMFMRQYLDDTAESGCTACGKPHDGTRPIYTYLFLPILHALKVSAFVFLINLLLGWLVEVVGEEAFQSFIQKSVFWQPFLTSAVGLIPNCASSVILTETFLVGGITFGSCLAGLCANAGLGFVVLLKNTKQWKRNLFMILGSYTISVVIGLLFNGIASLL
ncbi:MAG: arsenic efflux protein [Clostridia bacterium]|nr:arsenic efflux protein [Clostridia bacterium]